MGGFIGYHCWYVYGKPGHEYRSGRTPNDLTEFARQYRSWNMDYHRLHSHDDDTCSHTRPIGRFVRQSQTL